MFKKIVLNVYNNEINEHINVKGALRLNYCSRLFVDPTRLVGMKMKGIIKTIRDYHGTTKLFHMWSFEF
jgi:hypothetical protein